MMRFLVARERLDTDIPNVTIANDVWLKEKATKGDDKKSPRVGDVLPTRAMQFPTPNAISPPRFAPSSDSRAHAAKCRWNRKISRETRRAYPIYFPFAALRDV